MILVRRRHIFTTQSISSLSTTANTFSLLTTMAHLHYSSHIFTTQPYHDRTSSLSNAYLHYPRHILTTYYISSLPITNQISSLFIIYLPYSSHLFTIPSTTTTTERVHLHYSPPHIFTTTHLHYQTAIYLHYSPSLPHTKILTSSLHKSSLRIQVHIFTTSSIQLFQDDFKNLYYRKLGGSLCAS